MDSEFKKSSQNKDDQIFEFGQDDHYEEKVFRFYNLSEINGVFSLDSNNKITHQ